MICRLPNIPGHATVVRWLVEKDDFRTLYTRARENRADARCDRIDQYVRDMIAGIIPSDVCRVAIIAETWLASKENPKRYGESVDITATVLTGSLSDVEVAQRVANLLSAVELPTTPGRLLLTATPEVLDIEVSKP